MRFDGPLACKLLSLGSWSVCVPIKDNSWKLPTHFPPLPPLTLVCSIPTCLSETFGTFFTASRYPQGDSSLAFLGTHSFFIFCNFTWPSHQDASSLFYFHFRAPPLPFSHCHRPLPRFCGPTYIQPSPCLSRHAGSMSVNVSSLTYPGSYASSRIRASVARKASSLF